MKFLLFLFPLFFLPGCALNQGMNLFKKNNRVTERFHVKREITFSKPSDKDESKLIEDAIKQNDKMVF